MAKLHAARCPSCGANIQVPPHAPSVQCRYCGNLITVQHQKPPPMAQMPGIPSTTLYIDPAEFARASRKIANIVLAVVFLSVVLPLVIGLIAWGGSRMKSSVRPFPVQCAFGEEIEVSGDWTGTGPVIAKAEHSCKIHIKQAKLKAPALIKTTASNVEITLENVTLETTDNAIQGDSNLILHLTNTTITSSGGAAVKSGYNAKIDATSSKISGKKNALDIDANANLQFRNSTDLASEGVTIKTTSGLVMDMASGKVEGGESAIVATSSAKITATGVTFSAKTGETLRFSSSTNLELTDGAVTSTGDAAIETEGGDLTLSGTKLQGTTSAISGGNNLKLKASKKSAFVATSGDAIVTTMNGNLVFVDSTVEGSRAAIKSNVNLKVKPSQGTRLTGKSGGILTGHNFELDANNATIDGGAGPGLEFGFNGKITIQQGGLKGTPAFKAMMKPQVLDLTSAKVEGAQEIAKR